MVDSVEGSGKTSFLGGAGLEDSRLEDVQPDQEAFVEVIQPVVKGQAGSSLRPLEGLHDWPMDTKVT